MGTIAAMMSKVAAQPAPANTSPSSAPPAQAGGASAPREAASASSSTTALEPAATTEGGIKSPAFLPLPAGTNAITLQLPAKQIQYWGLEPQMWGPLVTGLAVVLTSIITLIVARIGISAQNDRTQRELEQARQKAHNDRVMEARREIYGEILIDFQQVQVFIANMAGENPPPTDGLPLSKMSASVNKLWIWGEVEAAYEAREFYSQVNEFYLAALPKALVAQDLHARMKREKASETKLRIQLDQLITEVQAHHRISSGEQESGDWKDRADRLDRDQTQVHTNFAQQVRTSNKVFRAVKVKTDEYLNFIISRQAALANQINIVMALARADVGLSGDIEKLNEQSRAMNERATAAVRKLKEEYDHEIQAMGAQLYG